jgi:hypothetical protein
VSGIAFTPDGTLVFGSRAQQQLYTFAASSNTVARFGAKLQDSPECVLVVTA